MNKIEQEIRRIIKKYLYIPEKDGKLTIEVEVDRSAEIPKKDILKIVNTENPEMALYEYLDAIALGCYDEEEYYILDTIREKWNDKIGDYKEYSEDIDEWVRENISLKFPYEHFLNQIVKVNVIVDTGDGNYDYTLNSFLRNGKLREVEDESSIVWLAKTHGYTKKEMIKAFEEENFKNSKFLESLYEECYNVSSGLNALTFFIGMELGEFIKQEKKGFGSIKISKETNCGLFDPWTGAGSLLDIELEKDLVIPKKYAEVDLDGVRGYSVDDVYGGMGDDFWVRQG